MEILIAYDGSEGANKGIDDLSRAGLPMEVQAVVVSVAEVWLPPPRRDFNDTFPLQIPAGLKRARTHAAADCETCAGFGRDWDQTNA